MEYGPFEDQTDLIETIELYESPRTERNINMFEPAFFIPKRELVHIMKMYETGEAQTFRATG